MSGSSAASTLLVAVTVWITSLAEAAGAQEIRVGIVGGQSVTLSGFADSRHDLVNTALHRRISGGVFLSYPFGDRWGVQTGISFVDKGSRARFRGGPGVSRLHLDLDYVEVPMVWEYRYPFTSTAGVAVRGGPVVGVLTSCEALFIRTARISEIDCEAHTEKLDAGLMGGLGVELGVWRGLRLLLEGSYNHGLVNVYERFGTKAKNRALQVQVGISAPLPAFR